MCHPPHPTVVKQVLVVTVTTGRVVIESQVMKTLIKLTIVASKQLATAVPAS